MRLLLRLFFLTLFLLPFGAMALLWFAFSEQPALTAAHPLSYRDIERAKAILDRNDPRRMPVGATHTLSIGQDDLSLALTYLLQRHARGGVRFYIENHHMQVRATVEMPLVPGRPYINLNADLEEDKGLPRPGTLHLSALTLPRPLARSPGKKLYRYLQDDRDFAQAAAAIRHTAFSPGRLAIEYRWQPDTVRALGSRIAGVNREAMSAYHAHLLSLQQRGVGLRGPLTDTLPAMFELARERSTHADPLEENRALLLVLGAWASERGTHNLLPDIPREPRPFALTLRGRRDLAQHFLVSAAIAAGADTTLSDAVGVFKEVSDSRGGSGFSFIDLTADRAGTRFGSLATGTRAKATHLQQIVLSGMTEADFMPPIDGLHENFTEAQFQARYGAVNSPAYRRVLDDIERRLAACRLYRAE